MKRSIGIIFVLFLYSLSFSQEAVTIKTGDSKLKQGILFGINGLNLRSFNGGFGYRKWLSDKFTMDTGFNINFSRDKRSETDELSGSEDSHNYFEIELGFLKHLKIDHRLSPYFGGQFGVGYEKTSHRIIPGRIAARYGFPSPPYKNEIVRRLTKLSLYISFGLEYFLNNHVSIAGQYNLGSYYGFGKEKTISNIYDEEQDLSEMTFGVNSSSLILSIYF